MRIIIESFKGILFLSFFFLVTNYPNNKIIELDQYYQEISFKDTKYYKLLSINTTDVKKIFIDIIIYIGDVEANIFDLSNSDKINIGSYTSINKIYFSINLDEGINEVNDLNFFVNAKSNSFYIIYAYLGYSSDSESLLTNRLQIGISYLLTVNPNQNDEIDIGNKVVRFKNSHYTEGKSLMISFFSLNCNIEVRQIFIDQKNERYNYKIKKFEHFSHDLIGPNTDDGIERYTEDLEYRIKVIETDYSDYEGKTCKVYTSAMYVTENNTETGGVVLIPDNVPQQAIFGKDFKHAAYCYYIMESENDLIINFNLKHRAQYKISIFFGRKKSKIEETIVANDIIIIKSETIKNNNCSGCFILLDITLEKTKDIQNPILEFSIENIGFNFVSYIPKNMMKINYAQANYSQYYYTELGKNEEGFITTNFLRGSGKVYARIVEKDLIEKDGNWRGEYILPNEANVPNNMKMNLYTKKISFSTYGKNCIKGCYLLMNVISDAEKNVLDINFPYSIIINSYEYGVSNYELVPVISVPIDEFVVGAVKENDMKDYIFQFYSVLLTSNSEYVIIDFQSNSGGLFINVGDKRPTIKDSNFQFYPKGTDSIYSISKKDILENAKNISDYENKKEIKDITLTLGIWTDIHDSIDSTPFAFVVRQENGTNNDIYRINSEQKALCKARKFSENKYRCVYVIEYDYISLINYLFIYPTVQNKSAIFNVFGNFIDQIVYEIDSDNKLKDFIPYEGHSSISNYDSSEDYLFINEGLAKNSYLLISVETDIETIIELSSTYYIFQNSLNINPSTDQMFVVTESANLSLSFPSNYMEMINIRSVAGSGELYWESNPENKYYLAGKDDRLSITSEKSNKEHTLKFIAKSQLNEGIGFIFYLGSVAREDNFNLDELFLDLSRYYVYSENDFPIAYFSPFGESIMNNTNYYDIFFSFDILENGENVKTYYETIPFKIDCYITKQYIIWQTKKNPDWAAKTDNPIEGKYDLSLKTGFIRITQDDIKKSGVNQNDRPYLYLSIKNNIRTTKYKRISLEMSAIKNIPQIFISEGSYQFGKIEINENERKYRLRINHSFKYMNLKFSCRNNTALSMKIEGRDDLKEEIEEFGRLIYSLPIKKDELSLILVISRNGKPTYEEYFTFQYKHSNNEYNQEYNISNTNLEIKKEITDQKDPKNNRLINYDIAFTPVSNYQKYRVSYVIKGMDYPRELQVDKADLALHFTNRYIVELCNPKVDEKNGKINANINLPETINYIKVIAQISNEEITEYLSYDIFDLYSLNKDNNDRLKKKYIILLIGISSGLFVLMVILVIIVLVFRNKNKDLIDKVKKVSFAIDRDPTENNEDKLLFNNEENK